MTWRIHSTVLLFPLILLAGSTRDGVYSKTQASRGQSLYGEECAKCHGPELAGGDGSPELAGPDFMGRWGGKKLSDLFGLVRKTMPTDDPGRLSSRQYADLIAFILSSNGMPAGAQDLPNDSAALQAITIDAKQ